MPYSVVRLDNSGIFFTGPAITTGQSRVATKRHGRAGKRASQEKSSYSNLHGVVSRSAIDWTTFFGKIGTEFAAREKSPEGKVPFRVNMRELVAGDCSLMCNCVRLANDVIHGNTPRNVMAP